ncbi:hypothetical protein [Vibrio europaeus]|uniref:hypothetical protein n=1 Tax=Vibrio europaeus TaxID=300876 RepID=UPI00233F2E38|nr:hypothetical protein [Vibrio europaeus]MDC5822107.1 hypothetical protein [Vibrio europaeus]MDC5837904.1 hypothetical protein [Vibrio europaeus]MDC5855191.1 hypothetical protein [Vibrio europaeus]MDC5870046.1 hypothetical protein [Vibrio europaeus]
MKKLLLALLLVSPAAMADIQCSGEVKNVLQYHNGSVNVFTTYRNDYTVMCNVKDHWKGVSPESCKGMLSVLLTAQSTGKKIATYYSGDQYTCQTLPYYGSAPGPVYVGIVND